MADYTGKRGKADRQPHTKTARGGIAARAQAHGARTLGMSRRCPTACEVKVHRIPTFLARRSQHPPTKCPEPSLR